MMKKYAADVSEANGLWTCVITADGGGWLRDTGSTQDEALSDSLRSALQELSRAMDRASTAQTQAVAALSAAKALERENEELKTMVNKLVHMIREERAMFASAEEMRNE